MSLLIGENMMKVFESKINYCFAFIFIMLQIGCGYQTLAQKSQNTIATSNTNTLIQVNNFRPSENGVYLIENGNLVPLVGIRDDQQMDLGSIPASSTQLPSFSIMGEYFKTGNLEILPYLAGIGVNLSYTNNGALIENVFDNSPAKEAGLKPGDLIISVDGLPIKIEPFHLSMQGMDDLVGLMCEEITLNVISGTSNKLIYLPRTYTRSINEWVIAGKRIQIKFQIEPKDDYVIIHTITGLDKGVYRLEFPGRIPTITPTGIQLVGPIGNVGPTDTPVIPTLAPTSIVPPIWAFKIL
jgi:hypothetical protein